MRLLYFQISLTENILTIYLPPKDSTIALIAPASMVSTELQVNTGAPHCPK